MAQGRNGRRYPLPPLRKTADGSPRRIGVEIELSGLGVEEVARIVAAHTGGELRRITRYEYDVDGDSAGSWRVELDQELLKQLGRKREERDGEVDLVDDAVEEVLRLGSEILVPVEVVSPALPMERLEGFDDLTHSLREAGGKGTKDSPVYAFGLQFNPEMPGLDAATIRRYLQSFLCLYDWLKSRERVDATRQLTGFAKPFPAVYVRQVVDPDYAPDLSTLMSDYLTFNASRNRALDMLPLFAHLDENRVRAAIDDPRIKPRPTLHYRLPNSELGRPDWGVHRAWCDWLQVERLASDRERLRAVCAAYHRHLDSTLGGLLTDWAKESGKWLDEPSAP